MPDASNTPPLLPELKIETWPVTRPVPYERNARIITQQAIEKVAASIKTFGWQQPIVVDEAGVVVVGHTRLAAAKHLGLKELPVHVMRGVSQTRIDEYRLADNRIAQETLWDNEILAKELKLLVEAGVDLTASGFDAPEVERYFSDQTKADDVAAVAAADRARNGSGTKVACPRCRHTWVRP